MGNFAAEKEKHVIMKRNIIIVALCMIAAACGTKPQVQDDATYATMAVKRSDCAIVTEYTAKLQGCEVVEVRPQVSGLITRICISEGQKVRKGQTLFIIDQVPFRAALAEATANVESVRAKVNTARLNVESNEILHSKNVIGDHELKAARYALAEAEASLAQAQAQEVSARNNLSYTEVRSPVDGVCGMIPWRVGALVSSSISEPLVTVSDNSTIYAYFSLTEAELQRLSSQQGTVEGLAGNVNEVTLRTASGSNYHHKGKIAAVSGMVNDGTGSVTLRADFPNPDGELRAGSSGVVMLSTELKQCVVIPQGATFELQNKTLVYKVVDGKAQSAGVTLFRLNNGTDYVVESGLADGDTIIAEGAGLVKEGAVVNIKQEDSHDSKNIH